MGGGGGRRFPIAAKSLIGRGAPRIHSFLGYVDLLGTTYTSPTLATGFGASFAQPLLREAYEDRQEKGQKGEMEGELMSREEAEKIMDECMKVLFYRDARSLNKVSGIRGCCDFMDKVLDLAC